jgi:hypothetical protein
MDTGLYQDIQPYDRLLSSFCSKQLFGSRPIQGIYCLQIGFTFAACLNSFVVTQIKICKLNPEFGCNLSMFTGRGSVQIKYVSGMQLTCLAPCGWANTNTISVITPNWLDEHGHRKSSISKIMFIFIQNSDLFISTDWLKERNFRLYRFTPIFYGQILMLSGQDFP